MILLRIAFYAIRILLFKGRYITIKDQHQINEQIREREVRLIAADGTQVGIVATSQAQEMAYESDLDLVKISPNAVPPVCKIMNYGKFRFESAKKDKEAKKHQKVVELKEIWLSMTIDTNDLAVKAKHALKFLEAGNKVKVSIRMRGRQNAHSVLGIDVMNKFFEVLEGKAVMERKPLTEGRNILMILSPTKA